MFQIDAPHPQVQEVVAESPKITIETAKVIFNIVPPTERILPPDPFWNANTTRKIQTVFERNYVQSKNPLKVVVDTNVLISAIIFGGKPRQIIKLIQENKIVAFTTPMLIAELLEILVKKFHFAPEKIDLIQELIKENFTIVYPSKTIHIVSDEADNRVLEAAIENTCNYIVTGDKDLLNIGMFKNISILKPDEFLSNIQD